MNSNQTTLSAELIAKVKQIHIRTRKMVSDLMAGEYLSAFKGQGIEFHEVREYQAGDDVRNIDWNVTARTGTPYIKRFVEERELTIMILVDISASIYFGTTEQSKREAIAEIASVFAFTAMINGDKVGLMLFDDDMQKFIPPVKGKSQVFRVIQEVLSADVSHRQTNITLALDQFNQIQKKKSVVFLISDFYSHDYTQSLRRTSRRHDLICVNLHDRCEYDLLSLGLVDIEDAETGQTRCIDLNHYKTRELFKQMTQNQIQQVKTACKKSKCEYMELIAGQDWTTPLLKFFRDRERRLSHYA